MQTHFTLAQLADPDTAESAAVLRKCVHCGFCTATCPTYLLTGDELDGPRGRIYLIKDMLEGDKPASATVATHVDRCLSCLSCMTTCPSGVNYMHLVDHARHRIEATYRRPLPDRLRRALLAAVLPRRGRFRLAMRAAGLARPFRALLPAGLRRMLDLAPARLPAETAAGRPGVHPAQGARRMRVALLSGCVQPVLAPGIDAAAIRLLTRLGAEVVVAPGQGCCGALTHHLGRNGHGFAAANIRAWTAELAGQGLDAIVVTASGCGTTVKDYGFMFRTDPELAESAARVASLACDVTEVLARLGLPEGAKAPRPLRVAYHSACSMQHGQRLHAPPRDLLRAAGFTVLEVPEGHICCGSAGTYNLLQPDMADALRARKAAHIDGIAPDAVATGNLGCMTQLQGAVAAPLVHTVELLDWASGGPEPAALAGIG